MHMINQGVHNAFEIPDTKNPEVKWGIFQRLGCFPLKYDITNIHQILITADKYTLEKLEWSSQCLHNTLDTELLTKVLIYVNISLNDLEVLSDTILVIHSYNFEVMEKVGEKLRDVKLSNFPWVNIHDFCNC